MGFAGFGEGNAPKRNPCRAILLSEASSRHRRIAVIGRITECNAEQGTAVLEDNGAKARIALSSSLQAKSAKPGSLVRVIGRPLLNGNSLIINAEIIQSVPQSAAGLAERVLETERKNYDFL